MSSINMMPLIFLPGLCPYLWNINIKHTAMKILTLLKTTALAGLLFGLSLSLSAQSLYQLAGAPELKVSGGSTIHDWEMVAAAATGKADISIGDKNIQFIRMGEVTMKATALKSGKGQMDGIAYKSLKAEKNPNISFKLTTFKNLGGNKASVTGNLTVAGATRPVTFLVKYLIKGNAVNLEGETNFNMTDFNITPPTAMLGTIKTDDKVTISFKALFNLINS